MHVCVAAHSLPQTINAPIVSATGGNSRRGVHGHHNGRMPPPSLLGPPASLGSGRGGTAPYPNDGGSRPISASDGWMAGQQAGGGEGGGGTGSAAGGNRTGIGGGSGGGGRLPFSGSLLAGEAGGGRGVGESTAVGAAAGAPPGAHRALVRAAAGAGAVVDPELVVAASGVRTGPAALSAGP